MRLFGVVMWAAAITSVVGAAFTSISFLKTFHSQLDRNNRFLVIAFILVSMSVFLFVGQPVKLLVWAGTINGFILPIGLSIVLIAARRSDSLGEYRHPAWLNAAGWCVVLIMLGFSISTIWTLIGG